MLPLDNTNREELSKPLKDKLLSIIDDYYYAVTQGNQESFAPVVDLALHIRVLSGLKNQVLYDKLASLLLSKYGVAHTTTLPSITSYDGAQSGLY